MDKTKMLKEIKGHYNFKTDAEFSRKLGINAQNLRNWYERNTFDVFILIAKCPEISAEWLLTSRGNMLKDIQPKEIPLESGIGYQADSQRQDDGYSRMIRIMESQAKTIESQSRIIESQMDIIRGSKERVINRK